MKTNMPSTRNMPTLNRRRFLLGAAAAAAAVSPVPVWAASKPDVIVLGAGLAGLNAALLLEQFGLKVRVLEASQRIGGRLYTLDDVAGHPEAGGNQIAAAYARTVDTAKRLGVALQPSGRSPLLKEERLVFHINGRRRSSEEWARATDNPLPAAVRPMPPDRALMRLVGASPLSSIGAWRDSANFKYDVPAAEALAAHGVSAEAMRLLDVNNSYGDTLAETSLLNLYYVQTNLREILKFKGPVEEVAGGNQRLPEAMAKALQGEVLRGCVVTEVKASARSTTVRCADGSRHKARFVVCALPLPALRQVRFEPGLPALHAEAVQQLAYARVTQLHLEVKRPFWEDEGVSPYLWSDGPLERIFPNDQTGSGKAESLTVWTNGAGTARWDAMPEADLQAQVDEELARVYPSSKGAVRVVRRIAWQRSPLAGGAWANWRPEQIERYSEVVGQPHGPVHFAGEHTAHALRGMEGAMESGERAASEILALL